MRSFDGFFLEEYWVVESRNVIVRLVGKSNNTEESFMVNAHYGMTRAIL